MCVCVCVCTQDPTHYDSYVRYNPFLPDINNERPEKLTQVGADTRSHHSSYSLGRRLCCVSTLPYARLSSGQCIHLCVHVYVGLGGCCVGLTWGMFWARVESPVPVLTRVCICVCVCVCIQYADNLASLDKLVLFRFADDTTGRSTHTHTQIQQRTLHVFTLCW